MFNKEVEGEALLQEVKLPQKLERAIGNLNLNLGAKKGVEFFQCLVQNLASALEVEYAFVGKVIQSVPEKIRTIAVGNGGAIVDNFEYELAHTPCEHILQKKPGNVCIYEGKIKQKFPEDYLLGEMGAESYLGVPLFNGKGEVIGLIAVLSCQPLKHPQLAQEILSFFAFRGAAELERQEEEEKFNVLLARERIIKQTALHIHQSLNLGDILETTVAEIRAILNCDRVLVYQLATDFSGRVVAESVGEGWRKIFGVKIEDSCYTDQLLSNYYKGVKTAINNIERVDLTASYRQLLQEFQVKANLVIPVVIKKSAAEGYLWGWLIAHQCSAPREWQESEFLLLEQLAVQLAIAIQQSHTYEQVQRELIKRKAVEKALRKLNEALEERVAKKTNELRQINEELSYQKQALDQMALVSITDRRGMITYVNEKFCEVSQYAAGEIIGKNNRIINSGYHDQSFFRELWQTIIQGKLWRGEIKNKRKDGSYYWVDLTIVPFVDEWGKAFQYLAISFEITERKNAEVKVIESEEKLNKLITNMAEGILVVNQGGLIRFVNPMVTRLLGYSQEELLNVHFGIPLESSEYQEIQLICKDHRAIFVDLRVTTINWEGELAYLASIRDITERKEVEEKLRRSRKFLQLVMDNIPQFIFWKDCNSVYLGCNQNFALSAGLKKPEDIVGKTDYELPWTKAESDFYRACDRRVMQNNKSAFNLIETQRTLEGKTIWLDTNKIPLHDEFEQVIGVLGTYENITYRKEAEEKLQQQLAAIEAAVDGIAILVGDTYMYLNQAHVKMFDYESAEELMGKTWRELYPPEEITRFEQMVLPLLFQKKEWRGEATGKRKNGSTFAQEISLTLTDNGNIICVCQDISERKEIEAQIRQSEAQFRAIFEQAAVGIAQTGLDGDFIQVNEKLCKLLGYSRAQFLRKNVSDITHPDEREIDNKFFGKLLTGEIETFTREKRYLHKNGGIVWVKMTVSLVLKSSGEPDYFIGVLEDISERKQAEAALIHSEEKLNSILNSIEDVVWSVKADMSELIYINSQVEKIYGRSPEEFYSNINLWLEVVHPEDRPVVAKVFEQILTTGYQDSEYRIVQPSGKIRWVRARGSLIYDQNGQLLRLDGITTDITEKKQAEEEIEKALSREKELNSLKTRFITMTSHEFRTPLAVISSSAGILNTFGDKLSEAKKREHIQIIENYVQHITELLEDILTINRTETGNLDFKPETFELLGVCQNLVAEMQLSTNQHTIVFTPHCDELNVYLDKKILRQILINLLSNGIKYSPNGGEINFVLNTYNSIIKFKIKDRGIGISPADMKHLFESFYRGGNVEQIQGTGLGLAIVKKCVEVHRGKVTVASKINVGTTFTVTLPLSQSPKPI
ncbi:MAG: PAS domain S-box protein [Gomphosphaeria aponina SAG 52.96 = DSM 107014]|uniref:histidine kinase n=1 Tax=Gomphosphaeria aponina SAG 52.96 = DSM 107014 TaxID=1521640 RepID=A0A941GPY0_9CHRO|nr:PAS domain S-box protein [Gomphosphaeria aponina SAG 52.96 = DSM 107014]